MTPGSAFGRGSGLALVVAGAFCMNSVAQAQAQDAAAPDPASSPAPAPAPAPSTATPPAPPRPAEPAKLDRVEVTAERPNDTEERRQSTAAKIVIGRDEIERFGDSTVGEILKRLPGVTVQGAPGRGGAIRMRGLGSGYTQILIDGERVPPGFSLDSLTPEQVERIEVLRAPTAETGVRAIAGTINIVTREGFSKRINDVKLGVALDGGEVSPSVSWTRNDSAGPFIYNFSLSAFNRRQSNETDIATVDQVLGAAEPNLVQNEHIESQERRQGLHLTSRLQWRGEPGESLLLSPIVILSRGETQAEGALVQTPGPEPAPYARALSNGDNDFSLLRLNGQWNRRLSETVRMEARAGLGESRASNRSVRNEFDPAGELVQMTNDDEDIRDRSFNANAKLFALLDGEHSIVSGAEVEGTRRTESQTYLSTQLTVPSVTELRDDLQASTTRLALYAQDEWNPTAQWAAHAGLRWESIVTEGDPTEGAAVRNRSNVWAPILHAVWKPEPKSRDQVRMSLTRSYKTPSLQNLIGQPSISRRYPLPEQNIPSAPDRVGNPGLLPELATGIDVAFEHYPAGGGILSANVFRRNLSNVIRSVTTLQLTPWSPTVERWVATPQNIGNAVTQGLELEAKFRLSDLWPEALPVDVRANASVFQSRVASVPGPDNRLDQQPPGTANLGADYRLRSLPLTLGGSVNWTPGYTTRLSDVQTVEQGRKLVVEATALWVFNPGLQLRLTANNLVPADYIVGGSFDTTTAGSTERETTQTTARTFVNWQLRLEMKL